MIYASNTSAISITKIAATCAKPENFVGLHFMYPVPIMKLVEINPGLRTTKQTIDTTNEYSITNKIIIFYSNITIQYIFEKILILDSHKY